MDLINRKYNYNLETGTVGTDDENIANILYNINRIETKKDFTSSDLDELKGTLRELYSWVADAAIHLNRFLDIYEKKVKIETSDTVVLGIGDAEELIEDAVNKTDTAKMSAVFPAVYKMLLDIVPSVLELDAQAVGRVRKQEED